VWAQLRSYSRFEADDGELWSLPGASRPQGRYELPLLLAQARVFSLLPVDDLILTHLDEEPRWGKIWNVVLGTNCPVRFLSAAQNVPEEFLPATRERILTRQFPA